MSSEAGTLGWGGDNKKSQERCEKNESPWILMTAFMEREQAHVRRGVTFAVRKIVKIKRKTWEASKSEI